MAACHALSVLNSFAPLLSGRIIGIFIESFLGAGISGTNLNHLHGLACTAPRGRQQYSLPVSEVGGNRGLTMGIGTALAILREQKKRKSHILKVEL